jgi:hypothetical protein
MTLCILEPELAVVTHPHRCQVLKFIQRPCMSFSVDAFDETKWLKESTKRSLGSSVTR